VTEYGIANNYVVKNTLWQNDTVRLQSWYTVTRCWQVAPCIWLFRCTTADLLDQCDVVTFQQYPSCTIHITPAPRYYNLLVSNYIMMPYISCPKEQAKLFLSEPCQVSTKFDNFGA